MYITLQQFEKYLFVVRLNLYDKVYITLQQCGKYLLFVCLSLLLTVVKVYVQMKRYQTIKRLNIFAISEQIQSIST